MDIFKIPIEKNPQRVYTDINDMISGKYRLLSITADFTQWNSEWKVGHIINWDSLNEELRNESIPNYHGRLNEEAASKYKMSFERIY